MSPKQTTPSIFALLGGVVVGVAVFLGVNITIGRAIIPTTESISNPSYGLSPVVRPADETPSVEPAATGPYQTVCITCHQAEGQGVPGAFPPLAGSEWLLGNPEIPVRIAILGLSGPVEVKGAKFNSTMPPPPGLDDAKIAEAITYARTHFGNHGSEVSADLVKSVRAALAGRTTSWTAAELTALQGVPAAGEAAPPAAPEPEAAPPLKAKLPAAPHKK
jgi:mono/diheme cytochrome c family protein